VADAIDELLEQPLWGTTDDDEPIPARDSQEAWPHPPAPAPLEDDAAAGSDGHKKGSKK